MNTYNFYDINEQPLKISEMHVEIEQYWDSIYKNIKMI